MLRGYKVALALKWFTSCVGWHLLGLRTSLTIRDEKQLSEMQHFQYGALIWDNEVSSIRTTV